MRTKYPLTTLDATTTFDDGPLESSPTRRGEELLAAYAETGNREAFEELVHLYEREIYRYLRRCVGDAQLAEDAFQTTFLQVHLKCRQFEPGRRLRPWLYRIATNQAVDLLRRNRRHKAVTLSSAVGDAATDHEGQPFGALLATEDVDPSEWLILTEDRERVRAAVRKIPAKLGQVLVLMAYRGLRYREAAEVLGIPLGTVKSRMNKAMQSLRETLTTTKHNAL
jgi:RNA polymerase sigma-70 factor, ECF subfamily